MQQIIDELNARLIEEQTAIQQYSIHKAFFTLWGYVKLTEYIQERIDDETSHYNRLLERIRFLGGIPAAGLNNVDVGNDVRQMHGFDLTSEQDAIQKYNATAALCVQLGDWGTHELIQDILEDEEDHSRGLQAQLTQISQMSIENYLGSKI